VQTASTSDGLGLEAENLPVINAALAAVVATCSQFPSQRASEWLISPRVLQEKESIKHQGRLPSGSDCLDLIDEVRAFGRRALTPQNNDPSIFYILTSNSTLLMKVPFI